MDPEEALAKLKAEYPEIEERVIHEALRSNDYDYRRASESIRARFYNEDAGIPQEQSFWSTFAAPFNAGDQSSDPNSEWDLSLETLQNGVSALGTQLLMGVEAVAETLGSLGDIIPDLIFGAEDESYPDSEGTSATSKDKDQVVVGGNRGAAVKKRGIPGMKAETPPSRRPAEEVAEYATDEETDDWTKED